MVDYKVVSDGLPHGKEVLDLSVPFSVAVSYERPGLVRARLKARAKSNFKQSATSDFISKAACF